jgi:hypothetical protein
MRWYSLRFGIPGFLLGCGDGPGPGGSNPVCEAPLQVFASQSVTPTVSWAEGCRVNQVLIRSDGPLIEVLWTVSFPEGSNPMVPPLEYGVLPDGAQGTPVNPDPLQPGQPYIIDVSISDTTQGGAIVRVGTADLTVSPPD